MNNLESVPGTDSWNFLDHRFITCIKSLAEALASLTVLSIPFESEKHQKESVGERGMKITAASNFILLKKEVKESMAKINKSIFVA